MSQYLIALIWTVWFLLLSETLQAQMPISLSAKPKLWLTAEKGILLSETGKTVASWSDALAPEINLFQKSENLRPLLVENVVNGQPGLQFGTKKGQFLECILSSDQYLAVKSTVFIVSRVDEASNGGFQCGTMGVTGNYALRGNGCVGVSTNHHFGQLAIFSGQYHTADCVYSSAYLNGATLPSNAQGCPVAPGAKLTVGSVGKGKNAQPYQGLILEILVFNEILNPAGRSLVENYLGAKYGIRIANDRYAQHDPAFRFQVAGVGMEADGGQYSCESGGLFLLAAERNGPLNTAGDYVVVGHNAPDNDWRKVTENEWISDPQTNGAANQRLRREWYLDKSGQLGDGLSFLFSKENLGVQEGSLSGGNFVLLYRQKLGQPYVKVEVNCSASDKGPWFSLNNAQLLDGYYTLGRN
jgi:hypothetical protein